MTDWKIVAAWGLPVLVLAIGGFDVLQRAHRSAKKLDRIIVKLNVTQQDHR